MKHDAADDEHVQVIRSFREGDLTFSSRCDDCHRWIWCGSKEREGKCVCGHRYRVVFDRPEVHRWEEPQGRYCMDCGARPEFKPASSPRKAWRFANTWQLQCPSCAASGGVARSSTGEAEVNKAYLLDAVYAFVDAASFTATRAAKLKEEAGRSPIHLLKNGIYNIVMPSLGKDQEVVLEFDDATVHLVGEADWLDRIVVADPIPLGK